VIVAILMTRLKPVGAPGSEKPFVRQPA